MDKIWYVIHQSRMTTQNRQKSNTKKKKNYMQHIVNQIVPEEPHSSIEVS